MLGVTENTKSCVECGIESSKYVCAGCLMNNPIRGSLYEGLVDIEVTPFPLTTFYWGDEVASGLWDMAKTLADKLEQDVLSWW